MASDFDFRGGKSRIATIPSTKAHLVKRHIACLNRTAKIIVSSCTVRELYIVRRRNREFKYGLFTGVFVYFERIY